jgi:carbon storage regulator
LVLTRAAGQSVVLDDRITVTVLASRGGTVRLGIDAPGEVGVRRGELSPSPADGREGSDGPGADPALKTADASVR